MNPIISVILSIIGQVVGGLSQAKQEELQLALEQNKLIAELSQAQADTNTAEATNPSLFVAGWRPCVGWVCALSFAWAFLGQPIFTYFCVLSGHPVPPMPALDTSSMTTVLLGMLGLGWMRSYDKKNGTATS